MTTSFTRIIGSLKKPVCVFLFISFFAVFSLQAVTVGSLSMPAVFNSNMVLQRNAIIPVWGKGTNGNTITVTFASQTVTTTVSGGKWKVNLAAVSAPGPYTMKVQSGSDIINFSGILVGEVWLCSGQSNMVLPVNSCANAAAEVAAANYPNIRVFKQNTFASATPAEDVSGGNWSICSPSTAGGYFAAAYFMARDLYNNLNVPIGILQSAVGGTTIAKWIPQSVLDANPDYVSTDMPDTTKPPASLYNGMVYPLQPFAIKGIAWYQGEYNAPWAAQLYKKELTSMINAWRNAWEEGDFPFMIVQLPFYTTSWGDKYPIIRNAQFWVSQTVNNTGLAVTYDTNDGTNLHPVEKQPVGARLALAARKIAYGQTLLYSGPIYKSMSVSGSNVILTFDQVGNGLYNNGTLNGFTVCGADNVFYAATAQITASNQVTVSGSSVSAPVAVRYTYATYAAGPYLYNTASDGSVGLPAATFATPLTTFRTGFEAGDVTTTWNNTIDFSSNVSGYSSTIKPECFVAASTPHTGSSDLLFSGTANGGSSTNCYFKVFAVDLPLDTNSVLEYWLYPQFDNARYVGIDFHCTDGSVLSSSGLADQNGYGMHPNAGHGGAIPLNTWSMVRCNIGTKLAGKTIDKIWIAFDRPGATGQFRGYMDDIQISGGTLPAPGAAITPSPAAGATNMSRPASLTWIAGANAISHDVYFGTSSNPPLIGNQSATTYNPGFLANNITYYWRVDEKNTAGITPGTVWSFTTTSTYLADCNASTGWSSANTLTVYTADTKEGTGCLQSTGTGTDEFKKVFSPYNSGATVATGSLQFWYYVSDITKFNASNQIELGSAGRADVNEYSSPIGTLVNGWNLTSKTFATAGVTGGTPDLGAITWFRIYHAKNGSVTTMVDAIQINDVKSAPQDRTTGPIVKKQDGLMVYPNPVSSVVTIRYNLTHIAAFH
jgi:sialate O-acetylesterase